MTNIQELERAALEAFRPPKKLSLSEWADQYAYLSVESSAEGGRWRTLPYQKGIMDAITDPNIEQVTVIKEHEDDTIDFSFQFQVADRTELADIIRDVRSVGIVERVSRGLH